MTPPMTRFDEAYAAFQSDEKETAINIWSTLADEGDVSAAWTLGYPCLLMGDHPSLAQQSTVQSSCGIEIRAGVEVMVPREAAHGRLERAPVGLKFREKPPAGEEIGPLQCFL